MQYKIIYSDKVGDEFEFANSNPLCLPAQGHRNRSCPNGVQNTICQVALENVPLQQNAAILLLPTPISS